MRGDATDKCAPPPCLFHSLTPLTLRRLEGGRCDFGGRELLRDRQNEGCSHCLTAVQRRRGRGKERASPCSPVSSKHPRLLRGKSRRNGAESAGSLVAAAILFYVSPTSINAPCTIKCRVSSGQPASKDESLRRPRGMGRCRGAFAAGRGRSSENDEVHSFIASRESIQLHM